MASLDRPLGRPGVWATAGPSETIQSGMSSSSNWAEAVRCGSADPACSSATAPPSPSSSSSLPGTASPPPTWSNSTTTSATAADAPAPGLPSSTPPRSSRRAHRRRPLGRGRPSSCRSRRLLPYPLTNSSSGRERTRGGLGGSLLGEVVVGCAVGLGVCRALAEPRVGACWRGGVRAGAGGNARRTRRHPGRHNPPLA